MIGTWFTPPIFDRSPNLKLPVLSRVRSSTNRTSCAIGYDLDTKIRSLGESIERHLSFYQKKYEYKLLNVHELRDEIRSWFQEIFEGYTGKGCSDKKIEVIKVWDLASASYMLAPAVAFTLSNHRDDDVFQVRDSSGTAIHYLREKALDAALREFVERQSLSLFWYFNHLNSVLHPSLIKQHLKLSNTCIFETLSQRGSIFFLDISIFSGYLTILAVFIGSGGPIWYSTGAASHKNVDVALNKSLEELYQAFTLMHQLTQSTKLYSMSSGVNSYLKLNTPDTKKIFRQIIEPSLEKSAQLAQAKISLYSYPLLVQETRLRTELTSPPLSHCVLHGVQAFPTMDYSPCLERLYKAVGHRFGYSKLVRRGHIPFA